MKLLTTIAFLLIISTAQSQDRQVQMKLDSVVWNDKKGGAILYGKSMSGTPIKFLYGFHRGKGKRIQRYLEVGAWFTVREVAKSKPRNGAKRAKISKNG